MMYLNIVPAYGRDYKSRAAVLVDWNAGKDFRICDINCKDDGRYINKQDANAGNISAVNVRYAKLTKVCVITNKGKTWK